MNEARIKMLEQYISEEPNDPFNHYALACEYLSSDESKALVLLKEVAGTFPEYLPTYYHLAQTLVEFEEEGEALQVFEKGIALAENQNNEKALKELKSAHQNLLFEMD